MKTKTLTILGIMTIIANTALATPVMWWTNPPPLTWRAVQGLPGGFGYAFAVMSNSLVYSIPLRTTNMGCYVARLADSPLQFAKLNTDFAQMNGRVGQYLTGIATLKKTTGEELLLVSGSAGVAEVTQSGLRWAVQWWWDPVSSLATSRDRAYADCSYWGSYSGIWVITNGGNWAMADYWYRPGSYGNPHDNPRPCPVFTDIRGMRPKQPLDRLVVGYGATWSTNHGVNVNSGFKTPSGTTIYPRVALDYAGTVVFLSEQEKWYVGELGGTFRELTTPAGANSSGFFDPVSGTFLINSTNGVQSTLLPTPDAAGVRPWLAMESQGVTWPSWAKGWRLQSAVTVKGPWTTLAENPRELSDCYLVTNWTTGNFFRLVKSL